MEEVKCVMMTSVNSTMFSVVWNENVNGMSNFRESVTPFTAHGHISTLSSRKKVR